MSEPVVTLEAPRSDEAQLIWDGLKEHNRRTVGRPEPQPFAFVVRVDGVVVGGINAQVHWDVLYVEQVWLDESLRGRGLGAQLLADTEAEGLRRGAVKSILDTNDWQAPGFYAKYGYREFGRYTYDAETKICILLVKDLS